MIANARAPAGANLGNGYTYAGSNPWSLVDPLGLEGQGSAVFTPFDLIRCDSGAKLASSIVPT